MISQGKIFEVLKKVRFLTLRAYTIVYCGMYGVKTGGNTLFMPGAKIVRRGGRIAIGANCTIHAGAVLSNYRGTIILGDDNTVNPYCLLYGHGGLTTGRGVRIAAHTVIIPANHGIAPDQFIFEQPETRVGIRIGDDVWIGAGVRILDGSNIARGCVIAAGAVLTKPIVEELAIFGGIPAKKIGSRLNRPRVS